MLTQEKSAALEQLASDFSLQTGPTLHGVEIGSPRRANPIRWRGVNIVPTSLGAVKRPFLERRAQVSQRPAPTS
jgi:hypothetical protein